MIMQRNALHFKDIGLNVDKKDLKIKKWFDKDCETAKKEVLTAAKTIQRYPKDPIVRGKYHKLKRDYKRLVNYKEHSFRETILQRIKQLESNDPKTF